MDFIKPDEINVLIIGVVLLVMCLFLWFISFYKAQKYPYVDEKNRVILKQKGGRKKLIYKNELGIIILRIKIDSFINEKEADEKEQEIYKMYKK